MGKEDFSGSQAGRNFTITLVNLVDLCLLFSGSLLQENSYIYIIELGPDNIHRPWNLYVYTAKSFECPLTLLWPIPISTLQNKSPTKVWSYHRTAA